MQFVFSVQKRFLRWEWIDKAAAYQVRDFIKSKVESKLKTQNIKKIKNCFQVLLPSVPIPYEGGKHRRQSLTASLHTITKSMSKLVPFPFFNFSIRILVINVKNHFIIQSNSAKVILKSNYVQITLSKKFFFKP